MRLIHRTASGRSAGFLAAGVGPVGSERYWDPKKGRESSGDTGAKGLSEPGMYLRSQ